MGVETDRTTAKIKLLPWYSLALTSAVVAASVFAEPWSWTEPWYALGVLLWGVLFAASMIGFMLELGI